MIISLPRGKNKGTRSFTSSLLVHLTLTISPLAAVLLLHLHSPVYQTPEVCRWHHPLEVEKVIGWNLPSLQHLICVENMAINALLILTCFCLHPVPVPGGQVTSCGYVEGESRYTVDRSPVCHKPNTVRQKTARTHMQFRITSADQLKELQLQALLLWLQFSAWEVAACCHTVFCLLLLFLCLSISASLLKDLLI